MYLNAFEVFLMLVLSAHVEYAAVLFVNIDRFSAHFFIARYVDFLFEALSESLLFLRNADGFLSVFCLC